MTYSGYTGAVERDLGTLDAALMFYDPSPGVVFSADTTSASIDVTLRFAPGFGLIINKQATASVTPGTNEWTVVLEVTVSDESTGWVEVGRRVLKASAGQEVLAGDGRAVTVDLPKPAQYESVRDKARIRVLKTGSPGDLTMGAWINPL